MSATPLRKAEQPRQNLAGEVLTTIKELVTGTCVKYHVLQNLLKMYDKFGQVLRLENLLSNVRDFKVFRQREGDPDGPMEYLRLRKGVADMHRRAEVGQKINERYAEALATVAEKTPLAELTGDLGQRTSWKGRPVRALNPLASEDVALLEAINHGEFLLNGFRNRDLRGRLSPGHRRQRPKKPSVSQRRLPGCCVCSGLITSSARFRKRTVTRYRRRVVPRSSPCWQHARPTHSSYSTPHSTRSSENVRSKRRNQTLVERMTRISEPQAICFGFF
jgi:hypothetical protein